MSFQRKITTTIKVKLMKFLFKFKPDRTFNEKCIEKDIIRVCYRTKLFKKATFKQK